MPQNNGGRNSNFVYWKQITYLPIRLFILNDVPHVFGIIQINKRLGTSCFDLDFANRQTNTISAARTVWNRLSVHLRWLSNHRTSAHFRPSIKPPQHAHYVDVGVWHPTMDVRELSERLNTPLWLTIVMATDIRCRLASLSCSHGSAAAGWWLSDTATIINPSINIAVAPNSDTLSRWWIEWDLWVEVGTTWRRKASVE